MTWNQPYLLPQTVNYQFLKEPFFSSSVKNSTPPKNLHYGMEGFMDCYGSSWNQ